MSRYRYIELDGKDEEGFVRAVVTVDNEHIMTSTTTECRQWVRDNMQAGDTYTNEEGESYTYDGMCYSWLAGEAFYRHDWDAMDKHHARLKR